MMPNVVRGDRMSGLLTYLAGAGRHNEHTEPHVVAGDDAVMAWHADTELGRDSALAIARHLDRPKQAFGTEVAGGHVWHCSLSLRAEEGMLTDDQWNAIARDFVTLMDFDDAEGTKAPTRWAAVRHGVSQNGNDHIHIVVNLVREDGTKASVHNDFHRAQKAARALEQKYGLEELESSAAERSTRGYDPAEQEAQARSRAQWKYERTRRESDEHMTSWEQLAPTDRQARIAAEKSVDQPRYALARTVRGCATAADSEGEFVRRMRRAGLIVRPRFAEGTQDVITGYSVARRPEAGERPIWYGGGHLGRDLTLPRLRAEWPDTPAGATDAAAEWNAAYRGRRVVQPGREAAEVDPQMYEQMNAELGELRERLRSVPVDDRETWARVARHTAGAFAAWSNAVEDTPGDLAQAADILSRSAQTWRTPIKPKPTSMGSLAGTAMLLASGARGGQGLAAQVIMIRQLANLAKAVYDAARATGELRQAQAIRDAEREHLRTVHARLEAYAMTAPAPAAVPTVDPELEAMRQRISAGRTDVNKIGSPLPTELPDRPRVSPSVKQPERGPER